MTELIQGPRGFKGLKGDRGEQGLQGKPGKNGVALYTWMKFADDAQGSNMGDVPLASHQFIGIAKEQTDPVESTDPADYVWKQFVGQGIPGEVGSDGKIKYTWMKFANVPEPQPHEMSDDATGMAYMGMAYNRDTDVESTVWSDYTWKKVQGERGLAGIGIDGERGFDGISIQWKGIRTTHPADPQTNWLYRNSVDGNVYLYDNGWNVMVPANPGPIGPQGSSIIWRGDYTSHPSNPQLNWAYKNTTDGTTYIYDGMAWRQMVQDGSDGSDGNDGSNGARGAGQKHAYTSSVTSKNQVNNTLKSEATQLFNDAPVEGDIATLINPTDHAKQTTLRFESNNWAGYGLAIHGDAIIDGTITADHVVGDQFVLAGQSVFQKRFDISAGTTEPGTTTNICSVSAPIEKLSSDTMMMVTVNAGRVYKAGSTSSNPNLVLNVFVNGMNRGTIYIHASYWSKSGSSTGCGREGLYPCPSSSGWNVDTSLSGVLLIDRSFIENENTIKIRPSLSGYSFTDVALGVEIGREG